MGHSLKMKWKGSTRADVKDFSEYSYAVQIKYKHGWETLFEPDPHSVDLMWSAAKARYRTMNLRLLRDDKVIAKN